MEKIFNKNSSLAHTNLFVVVYPRNTKHLGARKLFKMCSCTPDLMEFGSVGF